MPFETGHRSTFLLERGCRGIRRLVFFFFCHLRQHLTVARTLGIVLPEAFFSRALGISLTAEKGALVYCCVFHSLGGEDDGQGGLVEEDIADARNREM